MHTSYRHRFVLMQRLQDALTDGYERYQKIECDPVKARKLAKQFAATYETEISKFARYRRRQDGLVTAKFLSLEEEGSDVTTAFLMVITEGVGPVVVHEKLVSARDKANRITIGGYELVHDGQGWSWQYTAASMERWQGLIHKAVAKHDDHQLQLIIRSLYRSAGFRIVRKQVGELAKKIRAEWHRLRKGTPPPLPDFLYFVRRMPDDWTPATHPAPGAKKKETP